MMAINKQQTNAIKTVLDQSYQLLEAGLYQKGFSHIVNKLNEVTAALPQETIDKEVREECLQHPIAKIVLQEPATRWSFQKPRGYSGDAMLIDYLYKLKSCDIGDSYVGRELHALVTNTGSVQALRWRSHHIAEEIQLLQAQKGRKIDVISVASGHLRELAYISDANQKINRFVCIDQDKQSNALVRTTYSQHPFLEVIDESINYIIKRKLEGQAFDFIYSAGLFDYLNDKVASRMIEVLYTNLRPGGTMIIPNYLKGITEKAYMDTFMKWNLIYRDEADMQRLCSGLNLPATQKELYYDDVKRVVYLKITK